MIKSPLEKNRGKWPLGIVQTLIKSIDGEIQVVKLQPGKDYLERPVQHLYLLELSCDITKKTTSTTLNIDTCFPTKDNSSNRERLKILKSE